MQEPMDVARSETSSLSIPTGFQVHEADGILEPEQDQELKTENSSSLHELRLFLLEWLLEYVPQLKDVGGVRSIPFVQVLLMLASDLDGEEEQDSVSRKHAEHHDKIEYETPRQ